MAVSEVVAVAALAVQLVLPAAAAAVVAAAVLQEQAAQQPQVATDRILFLVPIP